MLVLVVQTNVKKGFILPNDKIRFIFVHCGNANFSINKYFFNITMIPSLSRRKSNAPL